MSSSVATAAEAEIWIVPFFGQGHLFPCIELCKQIASPSPPPSHHHLVMHGQMLQGLRNLLSTREPETRPVCAVIDVMMGWTADVCENFEVPIVGFFTSGACSAAARLLPGLPKDTALFGSNLKYRPHGPLSRENGSIEPRDQPHWMKEVEGPMASMFNTYDDLEGPFINYLEEITNFLLISNMNEDEIVQWLDLKSREPVLYVSFGTEVGPKLDEYLVLANALEVSNEPFIWVIQIGAGRLDPQCHLTGLDKPAEGNYFHSGLDSKASKKGLIIDGWAPQLLILNHQSMGEFISHCGWNSMVEAIGCGVPILAWPIRDDQHYNAKLVINHLKVGYMISNDQSKSIQKNDIVIGIEKLMSDQEIKKRVHMLRRIFYQGFSMSFVASLNAFKDLISQKSV
ncbi:glycosyltransferase [Citrus sinensis]|nr:glycosyltransferase [Citrus sinensis]